MLKFEFTTLHSRSSRREGSSGEHPVNAARSSSGAIFLRLVVNPAQIEDERAVQQYPDVFVSDET